MKVSSRKLSSWLRLASTFALGIAIGAQAAIGLLGLPYPEKPGEDIKHKKRLKDESLKRNNVDVKVDADEKQVSVTIERKPNFGDKIDPTVLPKPSTTVAQHGSYVSAFDQRLRNPAWACLKLEKRSKETDVADNEAKADKANRSLSKFRVDKNIPEAFRTRPEDFKATGYDRGHLVAAGDVSTQEDMDETFLMSNISPQVGAGMNRGFWQLLESFVRRLTYKFDDVYVCSGPLYLPEYEREKDAWFVKYQVIGPKHDIAVPTHFFKCIHAKRGEKNMQTCFIVPNRPIDHTREPLSKFEATVAEVERATGFELFPNVRSKTQGPSVCDQVKCDLMQQQYNSKVKAVA